MIYWLDVSDYKYSCKGNDIHLDYAKDSITIILLVMSRLYDPRCSRGSE